MEQQDTGLKGGGRRVKKLAAHCYCTTVVVTWALTL